MPDHCATTEDLNLQIQLSDTRHSDNLKEYAMGQSKVISNLFGDVKDTLKNLDGKMDQSVLDRNSIHAVLDNLKEGQIKILEQTTKHNGRMSKIERWQSFVLGATAVVMMILVPIAFMVISNALHD